MTMRVRPNTSVRGRDEVKMGYNSNTFREESRNCLEKWGTGTPSWCAQVSGVNMLISGESACDGDITVGEQVTSRCEAGLGKRTLSHEDRAVQRTLNHRSSCKHVRALGSSEGSSAIPQDVLFRPCKAHTTVALPFLLALRIPIRCCSHRV